MRKQLYGTRFTSGCGHSWYRRYPKWTIKDLAGVTTDCPFVIDKETGERCGELLIIPAGQFLGRDLSRFPLNVHAPMFHKYMHQEDSNWPADGAGTYCVTIPGTEKGSA